MSDETPPDFKGDLDGYLKWSKEHPRPFNPQWCVKHWAPCPVDGRNGLLASIILMGEAFAFLPENVGGAVAINSWFANQLVPICCKLGDEKMAFLWDLVRRVDEGEICGDSTNLPAGRHSCFYAPGHEGPHEQERPPESIFARKGR